MATRNHHAAAAQQPANRGGRPESWAFHRFLDRFVGCSSWLFRLSFGGVHACILGARFWVWCDRIAWVRAHIDLFNTRFLGERLGLR
jgi:hypothetical protein